MQPNALDITIESVEAIQDGPNDYPLVIRKDGNVGRQKITLDPINDVLFDLRPGIYSFESSITCEIPEGVAGWLISRSSLNRNGVFILSGFYDSGFRGKVGGTIYTHGWTQIEKGARVAQLVTPKAEAVGMYNGQYQSNQTGATGPR